MTYLLAGVALGLIALLGLDLIISKRRERRRRQEMVVWERLWRKRFRSYEG